MEQKKVALRECGTYKNFVWVFDKDLDVYIMSLNPVDTSKEFVLINTSKENQKDSIDDIIEYVDDYFNERDINIEDDLDFVDSENINEAVDTDSLKAMYGDLFSVILVRSDDGEEETVEFAGDTALTDAQDYIDRLKIDNDEFFSSAKLVDENDNILDSWTLDLETEEPITEDIEDNEPLEIETAKTNDTEDSDFVEINNEESTDDEELTDTVINLITAVNTTGVFVNNLKMLHWYSGGIIFDTLHEISSEYYSKALDDFDLLAELALEFNEKVINPSNMAEFSLITPINYPESNNFSKDEFFVILRENIIQYVDCLNKIYNSMPHDVQSELDTIIRYWTKENNYKNVRR